METSCRVWGEHPLPPGRGRGVLGISASSLTVSLGEFTPIPICLHSKSLSLDHLFIPVCLSLSLDTCLWVSVSLVSSLWVSVSVLSCFPALCFSMSLSLSGFHVSTSWSLFGSLSLSLAWIPCLCLSLEAPVSGSLPLFCLWVPAFSGSYLCVRAKCMSLWVSVFQASSIFSPESQGGHLSLPFLALVPMGCPSPHLSLPHFSCTICWHSGPPACSPQARLGHSPSGAGTSLPAPSLGGHCLLLAGGWGDNSAPQRSRTRGNGERETETDTLSADR